jgi:hypothetical protein
MNHNKGYCEETAALEKFYVDLADASKKHGFLLNYIRAEAPPCDEEGNPLPFNELLKIYGDLPKDWRWRYAVFLESDEHLKKVLRALIEKGYQIRFNFMAPDAILGNVVVKVNGKWFAIGECRKSSDIILHDTRGKLLLEYGDIEVIRLWSPFYVLANIKRMETRIQNEINVKKG